MIKEIFFVYLLISARTPEEDLRTRQDQQIDDQCASYLNQSLDSYAKCVAEKGRIAEQERQKKEKSKRMLEINGGQTTSAPLAPCNVQAALNACQKESVETKNTLKNPYIPDREVAQLIQSCRAACNPDSAQVLRNFLGGCTTNHNPTRQAMLATMNTCGTSTAIENVINTNISEETRDNVTDMAESITDSIRDGVQKIFGGGSEMVSSKKPNQNIDNVDPNLNAVDAQEGDAISEFNNLKIRPRQKPPRDPTQEIETVVHEDNSQEDTDLITESSTRPSPQVPTESSPININPNQINTEWGEFQDIQHSTNTPPNRNPINIVSQNTFDQAPQVYSESGISGLNPAQYRENRPENPSNFQDAKPMTDLASHRSTGATSLTNLPQQHGRSEFPSFNNYSARNSSRNRTVSNNTGSPTFPISSEEYYSRSQTASMLNHNRLGTNTCGGLGCRRLVRKPKKINCDGNPQCILALTGKLKMHRAQRALVYEKNARFFPQSGQQVRGISSISRKIEPGGIVRGEYRDIFQTFSFFDTLKLDHEGYLEVD